MDIITIKQASFFTKLLNMSLLCLIVSFIAIGCKTKSEPIMSQDGKVMHFGEKITDDKVITVSQAIASLEESDPLETKIRGKVESVCKVKGCWANIQSEDGAEMFVKFKDYGFFLPLDCEGQEVVLRGKAFTEVTPVDELKHYAEDEGKSAEEIAKITEPKMEYKFLADGVILYNK